MWGALTALARGSSWAGRELATIEGLREDGHPPKQAAEGCRKLKAAESLGCR